MKPTESRRQTTYVQRIKRIRSNFDSPLSLFSANSSTFPEPENDDDDDSDNEDKIQEEKFDAHNEIIEKLKADNIMENLK